MARHVQRRGPARRRVGIPALTPPRAIAGLSFSILFGDLDKTHAHHFLAEHGVSWMLPRLIGPANALDILWTGRRFEGEEAGRIGLADRVCEPGECVNDVKTYLREIGKTAARPTHP